MRLERARVGVVFVMAATVLLSVDPIPAQEIGQLSLEELMNVEVYSAGRRKQMKIAVAATVNTVSAEELRSTGATNLAEALAYVCGVVVERHPGNFPQYRTSVRGFFSDFVNERTLLMIDGIPIYHPSVGGVDPGWIPVSMIESIEVIKGPVSALYGANAFGGLVNVRTRTAGVSAAELGLGVKARENLDTGDWELAPLYSVAVSGSSGRVDYLLTSDGYFNGNGYMQDHQGQELRDLFGRIGVELGEATRLTLSGLISRDEQRIGFDYAPDPMENDLDHLVAVLKTRLSDHNTFEVRGYFNEFSNFVEYDNELMHYSNEGRVFGVEVQSSLEVHGDHLLVVGADYREDAGSMSTWELDWSGGWPPPVKPAGWDRRTTETVGVYVQEEYLGFENLFPVIGLRYDRNSEFGDSISPRLGLSYAIGEGISTYLTVGRAFRAPNYNELFVDGFGKLGNPDLEPEYTNMYEAGLKGMLGSAKTSFSLSIFHHTVEDLIATRAMDADDPFSLDRYENTGDARITGVEAEVAVHLSSAVTPFVNISVLDTDNGRGEPLQNVPETKIVAGVGVQRDGYDLSVRARYRSEAYFFNYNSALPADDRGYVVVDGVTTVDLFAAKAFDFGSALHTLRVELFVENLTDERYTESFASWVMQETRRLPGRTVGLRFRGEF